MDDAKTLRLQLRSAIYRPGSFVLILRYCANLKAIRSESMSLNRIVADKSHRCVFDKVMHSNKETGSQWRIHPKTVTTFQFT